MTDYIKRDALTEARELAISAYENLNVLNAEAIRRRLKPLLDAVVDTPAADVAEVVRCEGCKHSYTKNRPCDTLLFRWCRKWNNIVRDCDFCSYGERREE